MPIKPHSHSTPPNPPNFDVASPEKNAAIINGSLALLRHVRNSCSTNAHAIVLLELSRVEDKGLTTAEIKTLLDGFADNEVVEDLLDDGHIEDCIGAWTITPAGQMEVMAMCGAVMLAN